MMTSARSLALALALPCAAAAPVAAQQIDLPRPSPSAKVSQVVGLTEISVEYSSPAVKGRKIWGNVVPLGALWRTGANAATKVTFSTDVQVAGKPVPAGTYAIFSSPAKDSWTLILNKNPNQGGTDQYKKELDQLRFEAKPQASPHRERLTFLFNNTSESGTSLDLEWEKLRLSFPIKVPTETLVAAKIKGLEDGAWRPFNSAARYLLESKKDTDHALALVDRSLSLKEDWLNDWTKAQLLAAKGKTSDACGYAKKAKALGEKAEFFFFADEVKKALTDWKCGA